MRIRRYLLLRLAQFLPVVLAVVVLNFTLIHLAPGDISTLLAGEAADPAYIAQVRSEYGLDQPFAVQLVRYVGHVFRLDLGVSYRTHAPVLTDILPHVVPTLLLVGCSLLLSLVFGTWVGTMIARRPGSWIDSVVSTASISLFSVPVFWLGLMLVLLFAVQNRWLPSSGMHTVGGPREGLPMVLDTLAHLVLPVLTLSAVWIGQYVRLARTTVAEVLSEPYIMTVRAIGFSEHRVLLHYALRNALLPVVTVFGLQIGLVLTGAVLTETVFSWPGLGRMIFEAILARDTPVIMGAFILMSFTVALASLATDLVYAVLDPRVTY
jgi:peptide/nickel transport system permease protein